MHYSRYVKYIFASGIVVVLCAIVFSFVRHFGSKDVITREKDTTAAIRNENTEGVEYLEFFKGARANFRFQADRHYLGEDGMYHMQGNVLAESLKRGDEEIIRLSGQEVVFDKDKTKFILRGMAGFSYQGFSAETDRIEFSMEKQIFLIPEKVKFRSDRLEGSAGWMSYAEKSKRLVLKKDVRVALIPEQVTDEPIVIFTDELVITHKGKRGHSPGPARLEQGQSFARADSIRFSLTKDGDFIQMMELIGNVQAELEDPDAVDEPQEDTSFSLSSKRRSIRADKLDLSGFKDLSQLRDLNASGRCRFGFTAADGRTTMISAHRISFDLNKFEKVKKFSAEKGAKLEEFSPDEKSLQRIEGETMTMVENNRLLDVAGGDGRPAEYRNGTREISAEKISIHLENGNFEAAGGLQCVLRTSQEDRAFTQGLFSGENPVFVRASRMRFVSDTNRLFFEEKIKIWQEETVLQTEQLTLGEGGELRCFGDVIAILQFKSNDATKNRRIRIESRDMIYEPGSQAMQFSGKSVLNVANVSVKAETLSVRMGKEGNELLSIIAEEDIIFKSGELTGTAGRAEYMMNEDLIVLSEHPEVDDLSRGKIVGDKLTFHMAGDKIVVENNGQERSITVIK